MNGRWLSCVLLSMLLAACDYTRGAAMSADSPKQAALHQLIPIGLEGVPEYGDSASWVEAEELHLQLAMHWSSWNGFVPRSYSWHASPTKDEFKEHLVKLKKHGFVVSIADTTVHMDQKHLPDHLAGKRFNDPILLAEWEQHLEDLCARYGDEIDFFNIGNEIDLYFGRQPDEWEDYIEFFKRGAEVIRRLRPTIKIGIALKPSEHSLTTYWTTLEPFCDYLAVTYYTPNKMFGGPSTDEGLQPDRPRYFATEFERAFQYAGEKPVLIIEVGSATDPLIGSSPELQVQFIEMLFDWLPGNEHKLLGMLWLTAKDWPYETVPTLLKGHLTDELFDHDPFVRYLASLGLKYADGSKKPGYDTFRREVLQYYPAE